MPKVFFIQEPSERVDVSHAETYGEVCHLFPKNERPSYTPAPSYRKLQRLCAEISPEDYVAWAGGDPLAAVIGGMVLGEQGFSEFNFLRWERVKDTDGNRLNRGFYAPTKLFIK